MSASAPTPAEVRDAARALAPELTAVLGGSGDPVPAGVAIRIAWTEALAGWQTFGDGYLTTARAYLLAHRCTRDLAGTQGSTTAPIGSGATAGAIASASTGGLAIGYGASAVLSPPAAWGASDAELVLTPYGASFLVLRDSRAQVACPRMGW